MGWKDSKVGRKRRKKIDFDLTLLEGKEKRGSIGLASVKSKKNRTHVSGGSKEQKKEESNGKEERADKRSKKVANTL